MYLHPWHWGPQQFIILSRLITLPTPAPPKVTASPFHPNMDLHVYTQTLPVLYIHFLFVCLFFFSISIVYELKCALYCERCVVCMHKYFCVVVFLHCNGVYSTCTNLKCVNDLPIWNLHVNGSCVIMNIALWFMRQSLLLLMVIIFFHVIFTCHQCSHSCICVFI